MSGPFSCVRRRPRPLFPPPVDEATGRVWENKGVQGINHLTGNGEIRIDRTVYWKKGRGMDLQIDRWLGISDRTISAGARELCCRISICQGGFDRAAANLARLAQITLGKARLRQVVLWEGGRLIQATRLDQLRPDWTAADCVVTAGGATHMTVGTDGVMVPMVTEAEKQQRRTNRKGKRKGRKRLFKGYSERYKEFKIGAFYDQAKDHRYVFGTAGDASALGRQLRREACRLDFGRADEKQSVSDGAVWISRQLQIRLPVLDAMVLDFYHLAEHVALAGGICFGAETEAGRAWVRETLLLAKAEGAAGLLRQIDRTRQGMRAPGKRTALAALEKYVAARAAMVDYPTFIQKGFDIGSGPVEAFCKTLTLRLKGSGMKWDWPNAEVMMALAALEQSKLWNKYWDHQRKNAA